MIFNQKPKFKTFESENLESSVVGMDEQGMHLASLILRDKIYNDKILATIREIITNATDEHIKYGIDRPVEVSLDFDSVERQYKMGVRDFAKGLSEHDVRNIFGMYFRSTKTDTNSQTGCFGVGAKAVACYTDTYYVTSFFEGKETTYVFSIVSGHDGVEVLKIFKFSEKETTETGIEVSWNIHSSDYATYINKITEFIKHYSVPIMFRNAGDIIREKTPIEVIEKNGIQFKFYEGCGGYHVNADYRMGNVKYLTSPLPKKCVLKPHIDLVIDIPIGKMTIPITRENFERTPANSRFLINIDDDILEIFNNDLKQKKELSLFEQIQNTNKTYVEGKFFASEQKTFYADVFPFTSSTNILLKDENSPKDFKKENGKIVVCQIPSTRNTTPDWIAILRKIATAQNLNYLFISEKINIDELPLSNEITKHFIFKKLRSKYFGSPKLKFRSVQRGIQPDNNIYDHHFNFYKKRNNWGRRRTEAYHTPLYFYNTLREKYNLDKINDVVEAQKEKLPHPTSLTMLKDFSISVSKTAIDTSTYWTSSKSAAKALYSLGFFDPESQQYKDIEKELRLKDQKQNELENMFFNAFPPYLNKSWRDKKLRFKKEKHQKRLQQIKEKLEKMKNEESIRGFILNRFNEMSTYKATYDNAVPRKYLRTVIKLQDNA